MLKDSKTGYGAISILFHWVCAPLIIFLFGLGIYMRGLDYYSAWYHRGPSLHISVGILVAGLMLLRLIWRKINRNPDAVLTISKINLWAANMVKFLLYLIVLVICISGYLITTAEGVGASFFGIFVLPATLELSPSNVDLVGVIHKYSARVLMAVVLLHATAAFFHHFIKRDATLMRMIKPNH